MELKKIVIAEPLHSIGYLPLYIGQQEGFFAEEGLDVEVIQATGGSHMTSERMSALCTRNGSLPSRNGRAFLSLAASVVRQVDRRNVEMAPTQIVEMHK